MPDPRLRAVIVDDETAARDVVSTLLAEFPQIEVAGEAVDGKSAVEMTRHLSPDLLFLDVQMPGLDGLGVLDALGADTPRGVIFVTAHDEHAVEAFERHALDYLLKPFGRPRFAAAVARAIERLGAREAFDMQRTVAAMRIGVKTGAKTVIIETGEIDWVGADGDYVRIYSGAKSHLGSQRMHEIEATLDPARFVRVHRSVIVNIDRVRELHRDADGSGSLVLKNGVSLRVARARWETLERALNV
jgi:two-component system, LytTR family, response regulator